MIMVKDSLVGRRDQLRLQDLFTAQNVQEATLFKLLELIKTQELILARGKFREISISWKSMKKYGTKLDLMERKDEYFSKNRSACL